MADMKVPPGGQTPALRPIAPARPDAVRAAQRAFFDAALTNTPAPAQARAAQAPATRGTQAAETVQDLSPRYPRPGSRLDIKV
jgi:hypothetical protein